MGEYTDAAVNEPRNRAFSERVTIEVDDAIPVEAANVTVHFSDGNSQTEYVPHARGSTGRPMSDKDLEAKLKDLAAPHLPALQIVKLIEAIWSLDRLEDASVPIRLAAGRRE